MKRMIRVAAVVAAGAFLLTGCGSAKSAASGSAAATGSPTAPASGASGTSSSDPTPSNGNCGVLTGTVVDADGDTLYSFQMPDGSIVSSYVIGAELLDSQGNVKIDALTEARAIKLGIGPMPSGATSKKIWLRVAAGLKGMSEVPVAPCAHPGSTAGGPTDALSNEPTSSASGADASAPTSTP